MTKAVVRGIVLGAAALGLAAAAWTYSDVAVNHKDMFGYASVPIAAAVGIVFGGVLGGVAGFVVEGMRRARGRSL